MVGNDGRDSASESVSIKAQGKFFDFRSERGVLRVGIAAGFTISSLGIGFGFASGSFSILFDGFYALIDLVMTLLSLVVVNLIDSHAISRTLSADLRKRFSMGFWHLEPMVLGLNGILLISAALYALFNAVSSLFTGGRPLEFGIAIVYTVVTLAICSVTAIFVARANRKLRSDFVRLELAGWFMTTAITAALLIAFCIGSLIEGTRWDWLSPYVDPAVLALICLVIIPLPVATVRRALSDVLLMTPVDLHDHVDAAAAAFVRQYGLAGHRVYTARAGRSHVIDLTFLVQSDDCRTMADWDRLRGTIASEIGSEDPHRWLTIVFTGDPAWAE